MDNKQNFLASKGINISAALEYTGDFGTYNEVFDDFINGLDAQMTEINKYRELNDMPNYAILVHALKSNARCLGIDFLAELAYQHEMESKQNNVSYVMSHYNDLILAINSLRNIYAEYKQIS